MSIEMLEQELKEQTLKSVKIMKAILEEANKWNKSRWQFISFSIAFILLAYSSFCSLSSSSSISRLICWLYFSSYCVE